MNTNELPVWDMSDNPTGCCPRFKPEGWEDKEVHFDNKLFVRATTRSVMHVPLNMGSVFPKTFAEIEKAGAVDPVSPIVLSRDLSAWKGEHLFAATKDVPDHEMVRLSGDFYLKVYEGPFKDAEDWDEDLADAVEESGHKVGERYFFYTTCPKCAKTYGKNYVVGFAKYLS